ncbi:OmpA family protein, partial [Lysobacter sp. D1-1-M9]|uniref:OmpA family protein n=1 Tax=Novilysobacter longmucuonensis TaxID=3098603 RepID=UPI002FCA21F1
DTAAMAPAATVGDNNADTGSVASPDVGNAAGESGATRVYFPLDQAELTDEGRNVLDQVAQEASMDANTEIVLASYTDTTGTRPYNEELSERRGEAVRQYLVDQGIAEDRISVEAHGQSNLLVDTDDSVREDDNRRVRIEFGDEM